MAYYMVAAALIDVANGNEVPDAETLANEASCLLCQVSPGMLPYVMIAAIRGISTAVTGGGSVTCGAADPVAAPTGSCGLYFRTDTGGLWAWNGAAWVALIS